MRDIIDAKSLLIDEVIVEDEALKAFSIIYIKFTV